jgi:hypothetical protein
MMKTWTQLALAFGLLAVARQAAAEVPLLVPVQGVLTETSGSVVDGKVDLTLSIYAEQAGGTAIHTEVRDGTNQVDVNQGFFTVYLGEVTPLDLGTLLAASELWLGITVGDDSEMSRLRFAAAPFALEAQVCRQIGDLTADQVQPMLSGSNACPSGQYLRGWDDTSDAPICAADQSAGTIPNGTIVHEMLADPLLYYRMAAGCRGGNSLTTDATCSTIVCYDDGDSQRYYTCDGTCPFFGNTRPSSCTNSTAGYILGP